MVVGETASKVGMYGEVATPIMVPPRVVHLVWILSLVTYDSGSSCLLDSPPYTS